MDATRLSFRIAAVLGLIASPPPPALAAAADEFRLESPSFPAPLLNGGKPDVVIEASAVEPIGDGSRFLVAHDKLPGLYVVDAATGRLIGAPITSAKFPPASAIGPKWEGMALDTDGNYYLIGAHVGKTDEERTAKSYLFRFRLKDEGDAPTIDEATVVRWSIARSLVAVLKASGLDDAAIAQRKIEGLAVRNLKNADGTGRRELTIGLRNPGDKVRAFTATISPEPSPDAELELKPEFSFEAEPREGVQSQLTSLEYAPGLGGFLVVTASEDSANAFHGNTLWFVKAGETNRASRIGTFEVAMKAEGLAVLGTERDGSKTTVKLLITFDNDPHATKIPSRFQTVNLIRETR